MKEQKTEKKSKDIKRLQKIITEKRDINKLKSYSTFNTLIDLLFSTKIHLGVDISNRGDGKTYSHVEIIQMINFEMFSNPKLFNNKEFIPFYVVRHHTLKQEMAHTILDIIRECNIYPDFKLISEERSQSHTRFYYLDYLIFIVGDLGSASDLKVSSTAIKHCSLIIYDEFIALEEDYEPFESTALKLIHTSILRESKIAYLEKAKVLLLGNAMNFASPLIDEFGLNEDFMQIEINKKYINEYKSIMLSKNDRASEMVVSPLWQSDYNDSGEFDFNNYLLDFKYLKAGYKHIIVKYDEFFINIYYNYINHDDIIIKVTNYSKTYHYTNNLKDLRKGVKYIRENEFINENHYIKYSKKQIKFGTAHALNVFDKNKYLQLLDIKSIINNFRNCNFDEIEHERKEIDKQTERSLRFIETNFYL